MSTNLYYDIVQEGIYFGYYLKRLLGPKLWNHDGSLCGDKVHIYLDYKFYDEESECFVRMQDFLVEVSKSNDEDIAKEAKRLLKILNKYEDGILIYLTT